MKYLICFGLLFLVGCADEADKIGGDIDVSKFYIYDNYKNNHKYKPHFASYRKASSNEKFIMGSYKGITKLTQVYDAKDTNYQKVYEFEAFFEHDYTFLSGDGETIAYLDNDTSAKELIQFYNRGQLFKSYTFEQLMGRKKVKSNEGWLYDGLDSLYRYNNFYAMGDTLYVITQKKHIVLFDIQSGELITGFYLPDYIDKMTRKAYPTRKKNDYISEVHWDSRSYDHFILRNRYYREPSMRDDDFLPHLASNKPCWNALENKIKSTVYIDRYELDRDKLDYYAFELSPMINKWGRCEDIRITQHHGAPAPEIIARIEAFFMEAEFVKEQPPYDLDHWRYKYKIYVRKN